MIGPCQTYLLDHVLILLNQKAEKRLYRLAGATVDKVDDHLLKNAFALQLVGKKKIFQAKSKEDLNKWLAAFEKVLKPSIELPPLELKPFQQKDKPIEADSPQFFYTTDLDWLYQNPNLWKCFEDPDSPDNIEFMEDGTIRYATLDKLIQRLTSHVTADKNNQLLTTFMLTYRNFVTPEGLLDKLKARFNTPPPSKNISKEEFDTFKKKFLFPVRLRICQILQYWIEKHSYDFRVTGNTSNDQQKLVSLMQNLIDHIASSGFMQSAAASLKESLGKFSKRRDTFSTQRLMMLQKQITSLSSKTASLYRHLGTLPKPKIPRALKAISTAKRKMSLLSSSKDTQQKSYSFGIENWSSVEIARQLTLIEFEIFENIRPKELLNQAWNKENRHHISPNVNALAERTNLVVNWVSQEILKHENLKNRTHALRKFIKVARECRKLNNYNACFELVAALNSIAVHRLKKTWEGIPAPLKEEFKELEDLVHQQKNYRNLRQAIKNSLPPCLPYLGLALTDLTFIEDGNPNFIKNKINFFKCNKLAIVIHDILALQRTPYAFVEVPELSNKLKNMNVLSEDKLNEMSFKIEPKQAQI
jgi:son of sevenless-like protein